MRAVVLEQSLFVPPVALAGGEAVTAAWRGVIGGASNGLSRFHAQPRVWDW